jgi:hypothetical protein
MVSPEYQILIRSVRLDDLSSARQEAKEIIGNLNTRWDYLYSLATLHAVRPQLGNLLAGLRSDNIPAWIKANLYDHLVENTAFQVGNIAEFFRVSDLLKQSGITPIPFKGFWLSQLAYNSPGERESGDIDLYTDKNDLEKISEILFSDGYRPEPAMASFTLERVKRRSGEYNLEKYSEGKKRYHLEFHWGISSPVYGLNISTDNLASQVLTREYQGRNITAFTPSANFLLTVFHHAGKDPLLRLKQVRDIGGILNNCETLDWGWIINAARKFNAENLIYVSVAAASELTGAAMPGELRKATGRNRIKQLAANRIKFIGKEHGGTHDFWFGINNWYYRITSRSGLRQKLRLLLHIIGVLLSANTKVKTV